MIGTYSSFGDTRRRRRRLLYWRVLRLLVMVMAVTGIGAYAYQVGVSASQVRTEKLEADLVRFQQSNLDLRDRLALSAQRSGQAEAALDELRRRYAERVPQGEVAELLTQLQAQLQAGVEPERLAFLIEAAGATDSCAGAPVTRGRCRPPTCSSAAGSACATSMRFRPNTSTARRSRSGGRMARCCGRRSPVTRTRARGRSRVATSRRPCPTTSWWT